MHGAAVYEFEESAKPGSDAWEEVLARIEDSDWFIVLLTEAAIASKPVTEEIRYAFYCYVNAGKPTLIPGLIEDVAKPRQLRTFTDLSLSDYDAAFRQIMEITS